MPCELRRDLGGELLVLRERKDDADRRFSGQSAAGKRGFAPVLTERDEVAGDDAILGAIDGPFAAELHLAAAVVAVGMHQQLALDHPNDLLGVGLLALQRDVQLANFFLRPTLAVRRGCCRASGSVRFDSRRTSAASSSTGFGLWIGQFGQFLLRQPEVVATGLITLPVSHLAGWKPSSVLASSRVKTSKTFEPFGIVR